jgi:Leucine-rich repeat (LRR) protein
VALSQLSALRGLSLDDNRITTVPAAMLTECCELHTLSLRNNAITMQQMRELEGFGDYAERRKKRLDKGLNARIGVDFAEAADYELASRSELGYAP